MRVQLCEPLALIRHSSAFKALLTSLYDKKSAVVLAALEGLRLKSNLGSVAHLVKALLHQEQLGLPRGTVAHRVRDTLNALTGFDFADGTLWKEFWDEHATTSRKKLKKLRQDYLNADNDKRGGTVVVKEIRKPNVPKLFGAEIPSQRIVFVLDTSISMKIKDPEPKPEAGKGKEKPEKPKKHGRRVRKGKDTIPGSRQRLRRVQREFSQLISNMKPDTEFTIITFNSKIRTLSGTLLEATAANKTRARNFVNSFSPGNETWTDRALERAFEIPDARTIVLLSDGAPVRNTKVINALKIIAWVDEANRFRHLEIHTVGFANSEKAVGTFLVELSARNNGTYTELE